MVLTIQQAAYEVLKEAGEPLKSLEIAKRVLEQGFVQSTAKNPIQSISQALERNIRMNRGNTPKLEFVETYLGRKIQPVYEDTDTLKTIPSSYEQQFTASTEEITVTLPKVLIDKVKIYQLVTNASSLDQAMTILLRSGLSTNSEKLIEVIKRDMESL